MAVASMAAAVRGTGPAEQDAENAVDMADG
jgi:hypothetical protein